MILGIGSDLVDMVRIETALGRHGARFLARVFTQAERDKAEGLVHFVPYFAKRFAAKEACAKALGTGVWRGVTFQEIEIMNLPSGKPIVRLYGAALAQARAMTPPNMEPYVHLSLTDELPFAQAFAVIEARPINQ